MKACTNCNRKNPNNAKYCLECGNEFKSIISVETDTVTEINSNEKELDSNLKQIISDFVSSLGYIKISCGEYSVLIQDENGDYIVSTENYNSDIEKKLKKYGFGNNKGEMFYPLERSESSEKEIEELLIYVFYEAFNFNLFDYSLETNIAQISNSYGIPYVKIKDKIVSTASNPSINKGLSFYLKEFKIPIYGLLLLFSIYYLFNHDKTVKQPTRKEMIEKQFSGFSGEHRNVCAYIKSNLNDPDSFDHVQSKYIDQGSYLVVIVTYRAKNLFGGVVTSYCKAKVSLNGDIIEIIENVPLI